MLAVATLTKEKLTCFHCGDVCLTDQLTVDDKHFCCDGCKTVFEIISQGGLENYYSLERNPGLNPEKAKGYFDFLDEEGIQAQLLQYKDDKQAIATFEIPGIHCSSCIWLLENLQQINGNISRCDVNFVKKTLTVRYNPAETGLRQVAELCSRMGYKPAISLEQLKNGRSKKTSQTDRTLIYKLGVAGFCFGNIMLLAFPDYLNITEDLEDKYRYLFAWSSVVLALPVLFYSASGYIISAKKSLQNRYVNLDVPIAIGIITLFGYSLYEIITKTGVGFLDSLAALVFFMLIGKFFQERTYRALSFDRDYTSFFPLAVQRISESRTESILISDLQEGDTISIRNNEVIPVDGKLLSESATLDYSFITGEAEPVTRKAGEHLYAGGRQIGAQVNVQVLKKLTDSELLSLWNTRPDGKSAVRSDMKRLSTRMSKYFTSIVLIIAFSTLGYWLTVDAHIAIKAFCSVLIITCPCALALSVPFTYGSVMRSFARNKFFIKHAEVVEELQQITDIVFDKTGTLTCPNEAEVTYSGTELTPQEAQLIKAAVSNSMHTISKKISGWLGSIQAIPLQSFRETAGQGIEATAAGNQIYIGSAEFIVSKIPVLAGQPPYGHDHTARAKKSSQNPEGKGTYIAINSEVKGHFTFRNKYRPLVHELAQQLKPHYTLHLLSGDDETEKPRLQQVFGTQNIHFRQKPEHKKAYINNLKSSGRKTVMVGDGLNDAGALMQSDFGISITDDSSMFTPAADGILMGSKIGLLPRLIGLARKSRSIVIASFTISFIYNIIGVSFAVQGVLSPVLAAIIMPLSTITIVSFTTLSVYLASRRQGL